MKKIIISILFLLFTVFVFSCQKINRNKIYKCNTELAIDSASIDLKIMGTWKWKYWSSPVWSSEQYKADKNLIISFNSDHTYLQILDGVETTGNWNINIWNSTEAYLNIDLPTYYYGIILFCNDEVIFDASAVDGSCYLFKKEK